MKNYFQLDRYGTNLKREILGGVTTFLSMAHISAANPQVLGLAGVKGVLENTRIDQDAIFAATTLAAFVGSLSIGLIAEYPIALASGMELDAFSAFTVMSTMGIPRQVGLTGILFSGIFFAILTVARFREAIINAVPYQMKMAISAGIGLFITSVGLQSSGIMVKNGSTLITLGHLTDSSVLLVIFGIAITAILYAIKLPGPIFIGMIITAVVGISTGLIQVPSGIVGRVPSIEPTLGAASEAFKDPSQLLTIQLLIVILTFLSIDFFDTAGILAAVATQVGIMKDNELSGADRALFPGSLATTIGSIFGAATTTPYVESTSGVVVDVRTGFTSTVTGCCFLLALFFNLSITVVTGVVTTPVLVMASVLMAASFVEIDRKNSEATVSVFITIIIMPLLYSTATDTVCGFISYPVAMLVSKKHKEVHPVTYVLMVLFILHLVFVYG